MFKLDIKGILEKLMKLSKSNPLWYMINVAKIQESSFPLNF